MSRKYALNEDVLLRRAFMDLPQALREAATKVSAEVGADTDLVLAVMTVENLQRPPWFRRLERLKARLYLGATVGIMQVASRQPLTDEESIDRAVRERIKTVRVKSATGSVDQPAFKRFASDYSGGAPSYDDTLLRAYWVVRSARESGEGSTLGAQKQVAPGSGSAKSESLERWKRSVTKDQCMFCAKVIEGDEPAIGVGELDTRWVPVVRELQSYELALAHPHCFAVAKGLDALAGVKRRTGLTPTRAEAES